MSKKMGFSKWSSLIILHFKLKLWSELRKFYDEYYSFRYISADTEPVNDLIWIARALFLDTFKIPMVQAIPVRENVHVCNN